MDSRRNEDVTTRPGHDEGLTAWAARVAVLAREFAYPPLPDFSALSSPAGPSASRRRPFVARPAFALALVLLAVSIILLATPEARSAVVRVFQIGVARIFVTEPGSPGGVTPTPEVTEPVSQPTGTSSPNAGAQLPVTATPAAAQTPARNGPATAATESERELPSGLKDLAGRTTLAEAQQHVPFPLELPAHPPGLGEPDFVFVEEYAAPVLTLAWGDPAVSGGVGLSLWMFLNGTVIDKIHPDSVVETAVDGGRAIWTEGRHMLYARDGDAELVRLVLGNTLIWERKDITYRLETFLPLDEAIRIAESVR